MPLNSPLPDKIGLSWGIAVKNKNIPETLRFYPEVPTGLLLLWFFLPKAAYGQRGLEAGIWGFRYDLLSTFFR